MSAAAASCLPEPGLDTTFARGKKIVPVRNVYQEWDFLKGDPVRPSYLPEHKDRPIRFHTGFYRKNHDKIMPEAPRLEGEKVKEVKHHVNEEKRKKHLDEVVNRNGNVLTLEGQPKQAEGTAPPSSPKNDDLHGRKHFDDDGVTDTMRRETFIRTITGSTRYHMPINDEWVKRQDERRQARLNRMQQAASIIGYGRNDIKSSGVADNFLGQGLREVPMVPLVTHRKPASQTPRYNPITHREITYGSV